MKKVLKLFFIWRVWLLAPVFLASLIIPFRQNSSFTQLWHYTQPYGVVQNPVIVPWANFDGVHYLAIASRGYVDEGRFMPLFPLLVRMLSAPFGFLFPLTPYGPVTFWVAMVLSTLCSIGAVWLLRRLLLLDFSKEIVQKTLVLLLLFPTAFFLVAIYSESLFLFLSVLVLYLARKQKWLWASVVTMFLAVTRLSGILLILPLLYEYYVVEVAGRKKRWFQHVELLSFGIPPLLLLAYSYFNLMTWGDPLYFVHAHGALGNSREVSSIVFPFVTVYRYLKIFMTVSSSQYEFWIAVLEFATLGFASLGLYLGWKQKMRPSYLLFAASMLFLPLFSGTLSGFPRYVLPVFPLFVVFSVLFQDKLKLWRVFLVISFLLQILLLLLFARGYYVA